MRDGQVFVKENIDDYCVERRLKYLEGLVDNTNYKKKKSALEKEFRKFFVNKMLWLKVIQCYSYGCEVVFSGKRWER